jgi:hypothetical protein
MPFCYPNQYCWSKTAADIARIFKVSSSPAGMKYKFRIQVPKEIKNVIELDKKNLKQLWQEVILDSGRIFRQVIRKFLTIWFLMSNMTEDIR